MQILVIKQGTYAKYPKANNVLPCINMFETLTFDNFTLKHICDAALTLIHCDLSQTV